MHISYKELGFVNSREMFKEAMAGKYAVPAYNFNSLEQMQAIIIACVQTESPVILQATKGALQYINPSILRGMVQGAMGMMRDFGKPVPLCLHLDHGDSFELCKKCIDNGFSSVMIDGSKLPYEENIILTQKVVEYAHRYDVTVEGELGVLKRVDSDDAGDIFYTDPNQVEDFVKRTKVDSLAIAIGTSHGAYKFKVKAGEKLPELRFDILQEISKRLPNFPIVLHGSSSIPNWAVNQINQYGGQLVNAVGIPEEQLRKAAKSAVCKINVDADGRLVMTATIRKIFATKPEEYNPRNYLGPAREEMIKMYADKNKNVFGSAGRVK